MKHCLPLLLVALLATPLHSTEYAAANGECPRENCVEGDKCDSPLVGETCPQPSDICCSVLKPDHRTHCRHHGGECMDRCNKDLQVTVVDCPPGKVCCILI